MLPSIFLKKYELGSAVRAFINYNHSVEFEKTEVG